MLLCVAHPAATTPGEDEVEAHERRARTREKIRTKLRAGDLDERHGDDQDASLRGHR